jgi:ribosomal protein S8E
MTTLVDVGMALRSKIESVAVVNKIKRVDYGDVDRVTESIQVCVEPETKRTSLRTVGMGVTREFRVYVFIYFAFVTNPEYNREFCDRLAEVLEGEISKDLTLGGLVINGMVTEVASGQSRKDGIAVRANRLTFEGMVTDRLPMSS